MNKKYNVVLKSLQTIIAECKGASIILCTTAGRITDIMDNRCGLGILPGMFENFNGQELETSLTAIPSSAKSFKLTGKSFWYSPEWVKEFIEVIVEIPGEYTGRYKGEALRIWESCCGRAVLDLTGDVNMHINTKEDAVQICADIMMSYDTYQTTDYKGKYPHESVRISKSCCGCPLISIDSDGRSETFHVDTREDAMNICAKIMEVYA